MLERLPERKARRGILPVDFDWTREIAGSPMPELGLTDTPDLRRAGAAKPRHPSPSQLGNRLRRLHAVPPHGLIQ
ncbi:MAG: hypothetical protein ACOC5K_04620, partial [Chloroflexota bacterium]